jgi:hypothetical protein
MFAGSLNVRLFALAYWHLLSTLWPGRVNVRADAHGTAPAGGGSRRPARDPDAERIVAAAQRAVRQAEAAMPFRMTCLRRSLALQALCRRQGVATTLQIGVRKQANLLEAHAWVEHQGVIVGSSPEHCRQFECLRSVAPTSEDAP